MNSVEAKMILALYQPGSEGENDPQILAALEQARHDPQLRQWFAQHCAFQAALREKFRQIEVPDDLEAAILAQPRLITPPPVWWRKPQWLAAAAAVVLFAGLAAFWVKPRLPDRFTDYRSLMVRTAIRQYRMDIVTNDLNQIRQFLATNGAPADYVVPRGLRELSVTGAGLLRWGDKPVSMVCFDRGDQQMLFLFVVDRAAVKSSPPLTPQWNKVHGLSTASWSQGDNAYILAGPDDSQPLQKYW